MLSKLHYFFTKISKYYKTGSKCDFAMPLNLTFLCICSYIEFYYPIVCFIKGNYRGVKGPILHDKRMI